MVETHLFMYFQDGGRPSSWICLTHLGPPTVLLLMVYIFCANGYDLAEILQFYDLADLAGKCLFRTTLGSSLAILTP